MEYESTGLEEVVAGHVGSHSFINCTFPEMARAHHVGSTCTHSRIRARCCTSSYTRFVGEWYYWSLPRWNRMFFVLLLTMRRRHELLACVTNAGRIEALRFRMCLTCQQIYTSVAISNGNFKTFITKNFKKITKIWFTK